MVYDQQSSWTHEVNVSKPICLRVCVKWLSSTKVIGIFFIVEKDPVQIELNVAIVVMYTLSTAHILECSWLYSRHHWFHCGWVARVCLYRKTVSESRKLNSSLQPSCILHIIQIQYNIYNKNKL